MAKGKEAFSRAFSDANLQLFRKMLEHFRDSGGLEAELQSVGCQRGVRASSSSDMHGDTWCDNFSRLLDGGHLDSSLEDAGWVRKQPVRQASERGAAPRKGAGVQFVAPTPKSSGKSKSVGSQKGAQTHGGSGKGSGSGARQRPGGAAPAPPGWKEVKTKKKPIGSVSEERASLDPDGWNVPVLASVEEITVGSPGVGCVSLSQCRNLPKE